MMSQIPVSLDKVNADEIDREILRAGIIAEYDAINLYNQMADQAQNPDIRPSSERSRRKRRPTSANSRPCSCAWT